MEIKVAILKDLMLGNITYQEELFIIMTLSSMEKTYVTMQLTPIKWYEKIRNLTTGQGEVYTTGCLLDYEYIKKHYRLIANDLSRQKELNTDPKEIQQIEFVGQLKKLDDDGIESMFFLTILEKIKETILKFSQESVMVL